MSTYQILKAHGLWLAGKGGKRASLIGADLRHTDLTDAILTGARGYTK